MRYFWLKLSARRNCTEFMSRVSHPRMETASSRTCPGDDHRDEHQPGSTCWTIDYKRSSLWWACFLLQSLLSIPFFSLNFLRAGCSFSSLSIFSKSSQESNHILAFQEKARYSKWSTSPLPSFSPLSLSLPRLYLSRGVLHRTLPIPRLLGKLLA